MRIKTDNDTAQIIIAIGLAVSIAAIAAVHADRSQAPVGAASATIDLATVEGTRLVKGQWRYSGTRIVETDFRAAGADGQPSGRPVKTYDYLPHAGGAGFDDSQWETIAATTLDQRRSHGRLAFNWYRIAVTIPARIGGFDPTGATAVFETSVDDYAEIWVDGELTRAPGQMEENMATTRKNIKRFALRITRIGAGKTSNHEI